jgi:hypothetical protein
VRRHRLWLHQRRAGSSLTPTGFVAMAIGLLAAIMLGTGLARLVLNDRCGNQ